MEIREKRTVEDACPYKRAINIVYYPRYADREKSAKRKNAPWFRVIFAQAKIKLGEAQEI